MTRINPLQKEEQVSVEETARDGVMEMSNIERSTFPREDTTHRLFGGTIILAGTLLLLYSLVFIFMLQIESKTPIVYISMMFFILAAAMNVSGIVLTLRHQYMLGLNYTYYSFLIVVLTISSSFLGRALPGSILLLIVSVISLGWLYPQPSRRLPLVSAVVTLILIWVVEWLDPAWRQPWGTIAIGPIVGVVLGLLFAVFLLRRALAGNLRSKLLGAFIGVTVVATGLLGVYVGFTTSNILRTNLERELSKHTVDIATRLGDLFNEQINTLTTLALNESLQGAVEAQNNSYVGGAAAIQALLNEKDAQWRAADTAGNDTHPLVQEHLTNEVAQELIEYQGVFPDNIEVFITDLYGGLVGATNRTSDYYQADEGWWQAAYNNGQGAVYIGQPEFDESAGAVSVQIALPLRKHGSDEVIGIMRTTYGLSTLVNILSEKIGQTDELDIILPGEVVSRIDHTGEFEPIEADEYEELQAIADQGMVVIDYEGELSSVALARIQTLEGNPYVDNLGWLVVFHQHEDETNAPIGVQMRGVLIMIIVVVALAAASAFGFSLGLVRPILRLTATAEEVSAGNLDSRADVSASDEVGTLAIAFNTMTSRLQETLGGLEQRVKDRTRNLELAAEVGRSVSQLRELKVMLRDACERILQEFDLYYVQVYLTDPALTTLRLDAGTGEVGAQLLARSHSLPLNINSINGRAAVEKQTVVIADTAHSATFRPNPLLPDTRSEMAVPLIVADKVVGVLDMQANHPGVLNEEVLPTFEALAGQLAVAIQNTTLLAEAQQARAEVEAQARRLVRSGWTEYMDAVHKPERLGFMFDRNAVIPLDETKNLPQEGQVVSAPISLTGETLGSLVVEIEDETRQELTSELVSIVARQVAQQIENLRLLESAERYRYEAEQTARRQTREGWQAYINSRKADRLGYLYDLNQVHPYTNGHEDDGVLALPVKARGETVGKLSVQGLTPDDTNYELAAAVTERLGEHIESLRLLEETKQGQVELDRRAQQLAAVAEISTASSQELEVENLLSTVVHLTQRKFDLYHTHVFVYDEAAEELRIAACGWKEGDANEGTNENVRIPLSQEQSLVARAARSRQAVIVNDVRNEPGWLPNELLPDTASEMAVPLVIGEQVLGVVDVQSYRLNAFTQEDANIQMTLASQVATAMQNARSFTLAQRQAEREIMLNTINQKIQSATSVEAVLQIAARELGHALGAPMTIAQLSLKDRN